MDKSTNLQLWLPEDSDPLEVSKLSENFEVLDGALGDTSGTEALVKSMKIGDITYSTRNLEDESNGVLIACDQREVLTTAYPELCALPTIKDRIRHDFRPYISQFNITSIQIGRPDWNAKVGERYIPTSTITDANWNNYVRVFDLQQGKIIGSVGTSLNYFYIDDEHLFYASGSTVHAMNIVNSAITGDKTLSGAAYDKVKFIIRFKDKYIFTVLLSSQATDPNKYFQKWINVSQLTGSATSITLSSSTYVAMPNYALKYDNLYSTVSSSPEGYPFTSYVEEYDDALYTILTVTNVSNSNDRQLGVFKTTDGVNWTQIALLAMYQSGKTTLRYSFHILNDKMYVYCSRVFDHTVNGVTLKGDSVIRIINMKNFEDAEEIIFDGFYNPIESIGIKDDVLYAFMYIPMNASIDGLQAPTDNNVRGALMFNLTTKEVSRMYFPGYIANNFSTATAYADAFSETHSCIRNVEFDINTTEVKNKAIGAVTLYEREHGIVNPAQAVTGGIAGDVATLIYERTYLCPYNSNYIFSVQKNSTIYVLPREENTRLIPYIKNAYIKALNEEASE